MRYTFQSPVYGTPAPEHAGGLGPTPVSACSCLQGTGWVGSPGVSAGGAPWFASTSFWHPGRHHCSAVVNNNPCSRSQAFNFFLFCGNALFENH